MTQNNIEIERRLMKARADLMSHPRLRAMNPIIVVGEKYISEDFPTAATDGFNEFYNPEFIRALTLRAVNTVVGHENMHKYLKHLFVWNKIWETDSGLANIAIDIAANNLLYQADKDVNLLEPPEEHPPLLDERVANWSAGQIFQWCIDKADGRAKPLTGTTIREWNGKKIITLDDITFERAKGGTGRDGGGNGGDGDEAGTSAGSNPGVRIGKRGGGKVDPLDQHQRSRSNGGSESNGSHRAGNGGLSPEQQATLDRAIESSQLMSRMGTLDSERAFNVNQDSIPWQEGVRDWFRQVFTGSSSESWVRPHRRYLAHGIYLPTTRSKELQRILLAIDTSGSIGTDALSTVMARVNSLVQQYQIEGVDVMYWDSEVVKYETYRRDQCRFLVKSTKPKGGGGTDPGAVYRYVKEHRDLPRYYGAIVFTDGYTGNEWGQWDFVHGRVLWIIEGYRDAQPTTGTVLHRT